MTTSAALARDTELAPSQIARYCSGDRKPTAETLQKLALVLGFPAEFFLRDSEDSKEFSQALKQWRSLASATKAERLKGEVILKWQIELYDFFKERYDLPDVDLPDLSLPDFRKLENDQIEEAAMHLREHWKLGQGPIRNLIRSSERAGIVITRFNLHREKLDAVSMVHNGVPHVMLNTCKASGCRSRWDLAHELGHLVLHRGITKEALADRGKGLYKRAEEQAHYFAGALLLPEKGFVSDLWAPTFQCFLNMKPKWKVSIQAQLRRGLELDHLTKSQYQWLNVAISKKKIRKTEPLDDEILPEKTRLFEKCLEKLEADEGIDGLIRFSESMSMPQDILEQLCGVPDGYFRAKREAGRRDADNIVIFGRGEDEADLDDEGLKRG